MLLKFDSKGGDGMLLDEIRADVMSFCDDCHRCLDEFCDNYGIPKFLALYCLLLTAKDDQLNKDTKED